ncbi:MAG: (Fe-S)-binding protein [Proteobacteria bacterium]|nr:(Fe-S)-binding protein [Pseudomonadota bacterium]
MTKIHHHTPPSLAELLETFSGVCRDCGVCVRACAFLAARGAPGALATEVNLETGVGLNAAFSCSLCGLCSSLCPRGLAPEALFLAMRQEAVRRGQANLSPYRGLFAYEDLGGASLLSLFLPPRPGGTVFFPGCGLPGTRPARTRDLFRALEKALPGLGVVLSCCFSPSRSLGLADRFGKRFSALSSRLADSGVREVVTACPNCFRVFKDQGEFAVRTAWEVLAENGGLFVPRLSGEVTVHDPCPLRAEPAAREAARSILASTGLSVVEPPGSGEKTLCCGQGGAAHLAGPEAESWRAQRAGQAGGRTVVTWCAGCADHLSARMPTAHLLDILFDPERALSGRARVARSPFTYANRLLLKRWFQKRQVGRIG